MEIFICWSGDRAKELARALRDYLPRFIPGLGRPFFSEDIAKGSLWFSEVSDQLDKADAGLVCVTPEGLQSGWLHFEAGALARAVKKNERGTIYTYLLNVEPADLKGPLGEYQSTKADREDTKKLVDSLVTAMTAADGAARPEWEKTFDDTWKDFERRLRGIAPPPVEKLIPGIEQLFRRKTFEEPLDECTRQSWIERYSGVQQTLGELKKYEQLMRSDNSYLFDIYNELRTQLDGYAMDMAALLLREERFEVGDGGKLNIPSGIRRPCERRRLRVKQVLTHMLAPECGPVLEKRSRRFAKMTTFEEKKALLIHPNESVIQQSKGVPLKLGEGTSDEDTLDEETLQRCSRSWWEFDRIVYYLVRENSPKPAAADVERLLRALDRELEILKARDGAGSLIPMHYAIRALKNMLPRAPGDLAASASEARKLLTRIRKYLKKVRQDKGGQVRENIDEALERLDAAAARRAAAR